MSRIAMVAYTYYSSDPRVQREAEALASRGDEVIFYCLRKPGEPSRQRIREVEVRHLPMARYRGGNSVLYMGSYLLFLLLAQFTLTVDHLRKSFDLVHTNNMPDFMAFTGLWTRILGCPLILDIHDVMPELYQGKFEVGPSHPMIRLLRFQERISAALATRVLTSEHTKKEALIEHGINSEKIEVLLNLPDSRIFNREELATGSQDSGFRLINHGTIAHRLGLDIALQAVAKIGDAIPGLRLDIIGEGDHRDELIRLRAELGIEDKVHFSDGFVPVEELPPLIRQADLAVIPSRPDISTRYMLPTKLLEYAILGVPAVVAPTYTIRHYFDEKSVEFFEPEDPQSLADKIIALYQDSERRHSLVQESARFFEKYDWPVHKQVYLDLVDSLVRKSG